MRLYEKLSCVLINNNIEIGLVGQVAHRVAFERDVLVHTRVHRAVIVFVVQALILAFGHLHVLVESKLGQLVEITIVDLECL